MKQANHTNSGDTGKTRTRPKISSYPCDRCRHYNIVTGKWCPKQDSAPVKKCPDFQRRATGEDRQRVNYDRATRSIDGVKLAPGVLIDARWRPGYFRFKKADGSLKNFKARSVEAANAIVANYMASGERGPSKWTVAAVSEEAKKYETRDEFFWGNGGAHTAARKLGILDVVCSHMERKADFAVGQPAICYYARVEKDGSTYWKVGATGQNLIGRFRGDWKYITILDVWPCADGSAAMNMEKEILLKHRKHLYRGPKVLMKGSTEMFIKDVLGIDR